MKSKPFNFLITLILLVETLSTPTLARPHGPANITADVDSAPVAQEPSPTALPPQAQVASLVPTEPPQAQIALPDPKAVLGANAQKPPLQKQKEPKKEAPVPDAGGMSIAGSTITTNDPYVPGATTTMCFSAYNASPDFEWITAITLTLPSGWTAVCNSQDAVDSDGTPVAFACAALANQVSYQDSDADGWGEITDRASWGFCVDVTAPGAASGLQTVAWEMQGDGWGTDPHYLNSAFQINEPAPNFSNSYKLAQGKITAGDELTYTIVLSNSGQLSSTNTSFVDPIPEGTVYDRIVSGPATYSSTLDAVTWNGTVTPGESIDIDFVVEVTTTLECSTRITNTATITDPGLPSTVTLQHVAQVWDAVYYYEDLEADDGGFSTSDTNSSWEWGAPSSGPGNAHSGHNVWATNLTGDYNDHERSYLTSPLIDLRTTVAVAGYPLWLQWWQWLETEDDWDYASVEARGGASDWTRIYGPIDGAVDGEWTEHLADVSPFAGASDFQVRFYLNTDVLFTRRGWYMDDIAIHQCAVPPGLYLSPDTLEVQGCNGLAQTHTFNLFNNTGADGTFDLNYALANPAYGALKGPATLLVPDTVSARFVVTFTPELCLPNGLELTGTVEASGNGYTDTTYITKTIMTGGYWQLETAHPVGLFDWVVVSATDPNGGLEYIYVAGGDVLTTYRYDPRADAWISLSDTPDFLYDSGDGVACDDHIYARTDGNAATTGQLFTYDIAADAWLTSTVPVTVTDRMWYEAVELDGWIYFIGGSPDGSVATSEVNRYDPATGVWENVAPLNTGRYLATSWSYNDMIYVAGGSDGTNLLDSTEVYSPTADTWIQDPNLFASLPVGWSGAGDALRHGDELWTMGGYNGAFTNQTLYWTAADNAWHAAPPMKQAASQVEADDVQGDLYVVGGYNGSRLNYNQHFIICPECDQAGWLEGYVYDYDGASTTCSAATVYIKPGNEAVAVEASGYYTVALMPFDYEVSASAAGYPEPNGPYTDTILDGVVSTQDFTLARPDAAVVPTSLSASVTATSTVTGYFTITNDGSYTLGYEIREVPPAMVLGGLPQPSSQPGIMVEPELRAEMDARGVTGYLIYFRERPDLSPAFHMDWEARGRFVMNALQKTAERSQARTRAYLDAQGVVYQAFWIDNVIVVNSSSRTIFNRLMSFSEIEALRSRRQMIFYEPEERTVASFSPLTVEDNISHVGANQVWDMGFRGAGIVVANIDTGVRYTHEALIDHYRGNLGDGNFDHNYNWWDPSNGGQDLVPNDFHGHGSHTMGTMVGDDGAGNQIGMAPGASWIACQALEVSDDELLECGEFMIAPWDLSRADPDPDKRPHVVNNSWGDCKTSADHWYDGVINSWLAAGIYPVFANGNASNCGYPSPPGLNTVGNPARAGNVTGVGSTGQSNGQYAPHSNWGPTDNPDTVNPRDYPHLKPQVVAPGINIRSSVNGSDSDYASYDGTSMSAPHVAGLVALMWQAAPCLMGDYAATEAVIEETATPIPYATGNGDEGPGNVPNHATGWGEIDAHAAVEAAIDYCATDWLTWVATDPVTGTLASGDQMIEVSFTCNYTESQKAQPLQGTLLVRHNDPCQEDIEVDLELSCVEFAWPEPTWEKRVRVNGVSIEGLSAIIVPSDTIQVVDRVWVTYTDNITFTLVETWTESLALTGWISDTGSAGRVGRTLTWDVANVTPQAWYAITKTFNVLSGTWETDAITESLWVEYADSQLDDRVLTFRHGREYIYLPTVVRNW